MKLIKLFSSILLVLLATTLVVPTNIASAATSQQGYYYQVVKGDSLYKISIRTKTPIATLISTNKLKTTSLSIGQRIFIPKTPTNTSTNQRISLKPPYVKYFIQNGDTIGSIAKKFGTTINKIKAYNPKINFSNLQKGIRIYLPVAKDYVIYKNYTIKSGDSLWDISLKNGILMDELLKVNGFKINSAAKLGQVIKVPVHYIAVRPTKNSRSGQLMDWFTQAQYAFPINTTAKIKDIKTGKIFRIKRTYGAAHADVEALTAKDTAIMKKIWGGRWSWSRRPLLVYVNGYCIAASAAGMPHAGIDKYPADKNIANRSDHYGYGPNLDKVKNNNMNGHFDLYFSNSRRHVDNKVDVKHQSNVLKATNVK